MIHKDSDEAQRQRTKLGVPEGTTMYIENTNSLPLFELKFQIYRLLLKCMD